MRKMAAVVINIVLICYILAGTASVEASTKLPTPKNYKGTTKITDQQETVLTVSWSKVDGADSYEVYYRDQIPGDEAWEPWFLNETTKKTSAQGFIFDGVFQMRVRACKGSSYSDYTEVITVQGGKGIISGPKNKSGAKLNKSKLNLNIGSTVQLKVENTSDKTTWKSSDQKIASVTTKGLVKGIKQGDATITATVGKTKLKCKITVTKSSLTNSYKNILTQNISDSNSFALLDIDKDGQKELFLRKCDSASSIDWDIIVYSYYNGKLNESTICGQGYPAYLSSKKGIVAGGMFSSNEWVDIFVLKKGILTSIYNSGSHLKYVDDTDDWVSEALLNGKAVSFKEREQADEAAGIGSAEKISFYEVSEENIKKYLK